MLWIHDKEADRYAKRVREAIRARDGEGMEEQKVLVDREAYLAEKVRDPEERGGEVRVLASEDEEEKKGRREQTRTMDVLADEKSQDVRELIGEGDMERAKEEKSLVEEMADVAEKTRDLEEKGEKVIPLRRREEE